MLKLREIRKNRTNLSMKQLGDLVGVSESAIGYYETGKREPSYDVLRKLSEVLGCTVSELLGIEDNRPDWEKATDDDDDWLIEELQMVRDSPGIRSVLRSSKGLTESQLHQVSELMKQFRRSEDFDDS